MKHLICVLLLVATVLSCATFLKANVQDPIRIPISSRINANPFVLDIEHEESIGRGFIANGYLWTAAHVMKPTGAPDVKAPDDRLCLGKVPIAGLEICLEKHKKGDLFFYRGRQGIKYLLVDEDDVSFFSTIDLQPIEHGDSGSPIMCLQHSKVVGIVSHLLDMGGEDASGYGGQITKLRIEDIPKDGK